MNDKYDKHYKYRMLLYATYYLDMISHEEYLQMYDECRDRLDEI